MILPGSSGGAGRSDVARTPARPFASARSRAARVSSRSSSSARSPRGSRKASSSRRPARSARSSSVSTRSPTRTPGDGQVQVVEVGDEAHGSPSAGHGAAVAEGAADGLARPGPAFWHAGSGPRSALCAEKVTPVGRDTRRVRAEARGGVLLEHVAAVGAAGTGVAGGRPTDRGQRPRKRRARARTPALWRTIVRRGVAPAAGCRRANENPHPPLRARGARRRWVGRPGPLR